MINFDTTAVVETGGWDMVIGLPLETVNEALNSSTSSRDLEFSYTAPNAGQTIKLCGSFAPWTIAGGAGQDLILQVPIASGTCNITGAGTGPFALPEGTFDLTGLSVAISARLAFRTTADAPQSELVFAFDAATQTVPVDQAAPTGGALTGGTNLPAPIQALVPTGVGSCLAANMAKTNFVFAALTSTIGGGDVPLPMCGAQWQYVVASRQGDAVQTLAIFYASVSDPTLGADIPSPIGTAGGDCILVLSPSMAARAAVIPAIVYGLDYNVAPAAPLPGMGLELFVIPPINDIPEDCFEVLPSAKGDSGTTIRLRGPLDINIGGLPRATSATLAQLVCTLHGTVLTLEVTGCLSIDPDTSYSGSSQFSIVVGPSPDDSSGEVRVSLMPVGMISAFAPNYEAHLLLMCIQHGIAFNPSPFSFTFFGSQRLRLEQGYYNGGLVLSGALASLGNSPSA